MRGENLGIGCGLFWLSITIIISVLPAAYKQVMQLQKKSKFLERKKKQNNRNRVKPQKKKKTPRCFIRWVPFWSTFLSDVIWCQNSYKNNARGQEIIWWLKSDPKVGYCINFPICLGFCSLSMQPCEMPTSATNVELIYIMHPNFQMVWGHQFTRKW